MWCIAWPEGSNCTQCHVANANLLTDSVPATHGPCASHSILTLLFQALFFPALLFQALFFQALLFEASLTL